MVREIRKETSFFGIEKDVIYEDGKKIGEIRHEKTTNFYSFGITDVPIDRTYDPKGDLISETRHEKK